MSTNTLAISLGLNVATHTRIVDELKSQKLAASSLGKVHLHVPLVTLPDTTAALSELPAKLTAFSSTVKEPLQVKLTGKRIQGKTVVAVALAEADPVLALATQLLAHLDIKTATNALTNGRHEPSVVIYEGDDTLNVLEAINKAGAASAPSLFKGTETLPFDGLELFVTYHDCKIGAHIPVGKSTFASTWFYRTSLYINGRWQRSTTGGVLPVENPSNRKTFHFVTAAEPGDVDKAVNAASAAFDTWGVTPAPERAKYINAMADYIDKHKESIAKLESLDNGKALKESILDVADVVTCFRYYANQAVSYEANQTPTVDVGDPTFSAQVHYEPVGVCGLIIPWNYPLLMAAWKVAPCIAAGCTAVLKPSELTPLTALELAAAAEAAGLPAGVLNIINGYGPTAGGPLTNHAKVDKLAFTGSVATGSKVMEAASKSIKKVSLELGGKSPIIVCKDADIEQAVDWAMVGIFFNQGQVCSATSRLLIHQDIKEQFLVRLVEETRTLTLGDGLLDTTQVGPIVNQTQYDKVLKYIETGKKEGAKVVVGGGPAPNQGALGGGYFIQPTIFTEVNPTMTIWKEEIFGPVLAVTTFSTEEEAIRLANDTIYGLAAAVISKDKSTTDRIARKLRVGIVWINCSQPTLVQLPWGGMKQSGIGRELGPWGLMNYVEAKQVLAWVDPNSTGWGWFKKSKL